MRIRTAYKVGQRFGRRTIIGVAVERPPRWQWRCECGNEGQAVGAEMKRFPSCGCLQREAARALRTSHGKTDTKLHMIWCQIRQRCGNPRNRAYHNYGGRGIRLCQKWEDYEAFWRDMAPTWQPGLTIERINVNGNYEPGNCTWIPRSEQVKNRRSPSEWRKPAKRGASNGTSAQHI